MSNTLYYGDNLSHLQELEPETIDLIYLDPPFNSKTNYDVLYGKEVQGEEKSQIEAFKDTWQWSVESRKLYERLSSCVELKSLVSGLYTLLKESGMMNYLMYMAERLVFMHKVLKDTGSIYLHCDPTASHYLKIVMDSVFGKKNFRNEVVWAYRTGGASKKQFARKHDIILFYGKSSSTYYAILKEKAYTKSKNRKEGIVNYGRGEAKFFRDEKGIYNWVHMRDLWEISYLNSQAEERLGYPTQKPLELLDRIVRASSKEGDVVLDPFCGCGTSMSAAEKLGRKWIGIDISHFSINLVEKRLKNEYKDRLSLYEVKGVPTSLKGAEKLFVQTLGNALGMEPKNVKEALALAESGNEKVKHKKNAGRFEFQRWVCSLFDAYPNDREIGDGGYDGQILWKDYQSKDTGDIAEKEIWGALEVKSSEQITPAQLRALKGLISKGGKFMVGMIVSLYKGDTEELRRICASFENPEWTHHTGKKYPRLQVFSVEEYFQGKKLNIPTPEAMYKTASFVRSKKQMPVPY